MLIDYEIRKGLAKTIRESEPTYWLTLHWHESYVPSDRVLSNLKRLHREVDEARLGSHYNRASKAADRARAIFIIEKSDISTHAHSFWKVESEIESFEALFIDGEQGKGIWGTKIAHHGTSCLRRYDPERGAVEYSLKEQGRESPANSIFSSEAFLSGKQKAALAAL